MLQRRKIGRDLARIADLAQLTAADSLSTVALDGTGVLYLMNTAFILGYLVSISKLRSLSLRYDRVTDSLQMMY